MVDAEAEALPPLLLVTPGTASAAVSASSARALSAAGSGSTPSQLSSSGKVAVISNSAGRESGIRVVGRFARHRQHPADQRRSASSRRSDDDTLADLLAEKDAQADLFAFGAVDVLQRALAHLHAARPFADIDGVGGFGARRRGPVRPVSRLCRGLRRRSTWAAVRRSIDRAQAHDQHRQRTPAARTSGWTGTEPAPPPRPSGRRAGLAGEVEGGRDQGEQRQPVRLHLPDRRAPPAKRERIENARSPSGALSPSRRALDFTPTSASSSMSWMA